jgi:predicted O-methyltransferase YrrM
VEISSQAAQRARENLASFSERVELVNDDLLDYESSIEGSSVDVCIWSESVYYLGARLSLHGIFDLLQRVIGKLRPGGLLIMANAVNLPGEVPESAITSRPLIDCYYQLLSALAEPVQRAIYKDKKAGQIYEYQIWLFRKG